MTLQSKFLGALHIVMGEAHVIGETPQGFRRVRVFQGGSFKGPRIAGRIVSGGSDAWMRGRDQAVRPDVRLVVETGDGACIYITYKGVRHGPPDVMARIERNEPVPDDAYYLRNIATFETGAPAYDWLNRIVAVGVGRRAPNAVIYDMYEIL